FKIQPTISRPISTRFGHLSLRGSLLSWKAKTCLQQSSNGSRHRSLLEKRKQLLVSPHEEDYFDERGSCRRWSLFASRASWIDNLLRRANPARSQKRADCSRRHRRTNTACA